MEVSELGDDDYGVAALPLQSQDVSKKLQCHPENSENCLVRCHVTHVALPAPSDGKNFSNTGQQVADLVLFSGDSVTVSVCAADASCTYPPWMMLHLNEGILQSGWGCTAIKRYFVSFWSGVDLRYKLLKRPRICISIAGIIISRVRLKALLHGDSRESCGVDLKCSTAGPCVVPVLWGRR